MANGASIIHFHSQNDNCYLYVKRSVDMFSMAIAYQYSIKDKIGNLIHDDFTNIFEDSSVTNELAYSIISRNITRYSDISNVYEIDLEKDILSILNKGSHRWKFYHLCDIEKAINSATLNLELSIKDKQNIFLRQLIGKELYKSTYYDE